MKAERPTAPAVPPDEQAALTAFYLKAGGKAWSEQAGWLDDASVCTWYGVTCERGHVVALDLSDNRLRGALPSELGMLTELEHLDLSDNHLRGVIPPELGHLRELKVLNLSNNYLRGEIPARLRLLRDLRALDLRQNRLTGEIPAGLGDLARLQYLNLAANELTGSVPASLGNLRHLIELHLGDNQLAGPLPGAMANLAAVETFSFLHTGLLERADPEFRAWLESIEYLESPGVVYEETATSGNPTLAALAGAGTMGIALIASLVMMILLGPVGAAVGALTGVAGAGLVGKTVYELTRKPQAALPSPRPTDPDEALRQQLRQELRGLVTNAEGRVPADVLRRLEQLERTLLFVLDRMERIGSGDRDAYTVRQTILDYLPAALSGYRSLPAEFAQEEPIQEGMTAHEHLLHQLDLMQEAIEEIAARLPKEDAQRLLSHGRFLEGRFRRSEDPFALDDEG